MNSETFGLEQPGSRPLILLHGWGNSIDTTRAFAQQLGSYTRVFALDLPGHGKSPVPEEIWGMKEFAECLKAFLDQQQLHTVDLVGHSFGGKTVIKFAALFPDYVHRIVLIGASGLRPRPTLRRRLRSMMLAGLRKLIRFKNTRLGMKIYQEWYIPRFASRDYLNAGPMTRIFVKTVNEELQQELTQIKSDCLLLWGAEDDESPPSVGREMQRLIRAATFIEIPAQGHHPFVGNGAPLVIKYIRDFLFR